MLYPRNEIAKHLFSVGISQTDTVFIHGNAGVAGQYIFPETSDPTTEFLRDVIDYLKDGTVIVPAFSYSSTLGETFDPKKTPSRVGLFSESFRLLDVAKRSVDPTFSVCSVGVNRDRYLDTSCEDCFGKGSIFEKLLSDNVKILVLGCRLDTVTFVHHIEQKLKVSYRYFKNFNCSILKNGKSSSVRVKYFVRYPNIDADLDYVSLENLCSSKKQIFKRAFGRFPAFVISTQDLAEIVSEAIELNEFSIIKEKLRNR